MMRAAAFRLSLIAALALPLLSAATAEGAAGKKPGARTKFTVYPKQRSKRWNGYGFLPGYRQPPALTDWRARRAPSGPEVRYWSLYDGEWHYGWGRPGFYRGRWTGGSFGPCWTYTPIGMMWNCGP